MSILDLITRRRTAIIFMLVGLLLVMNVVSITITEAGGREMYKYESQEVTYNESSGFILDGNPDGLERVDEDVTCLERDRTPGCVLALKVYEGTDLEVSRFVTNNKFARPKYAYVMGIGFFEWGVNESGYLELQEVEYEVVFRSTSVPFDVASSEARKAIKNGKVTTNDKPPEVNQLIEYKGDFYILDRIEYASSWGQGVFFGLLDGLGFVFGIGLLLFGYADYRETTHTKS